MASLTVIVSAVRVATARWQVSMRRYEVGGTSGGSNRSCCPHCQRFDAPRKLAFQLKRLTTYQDEVPQARRLGSLPVAAVLQATAQHFAVDPGVFTERRSTHLARDIAAWLARRLTTATLREMAPVFGLTHPDSVSNLTRRAARALAKDQKLRRQVETLRRALVTLRRALVASESEQ